ncbi:MAG: divergent polysaccharide deacetylase family protein, partial [Serratia inhibens]
VKPSSLLNEPQGNSSGGNYVPPPVKPQKPQPKNPFTGSIKQCKIKLPKEKVSAGKAISVIGESVAQSPAAAFIKRQWHRWADSAPNQSKA